MERPSVSQLDNGLRVISLRMPSMASVSIGVWVGVGSRYEEERLGGVSHFLEHLLFKGTRKRTAKQITEQIEGIGGSINAFTSEEHTCYTVKVHYGHVARGVEILGDMILNSTLDPVEVRRERNVIVEEMHMAKDNPTEYVQDLLGQLLWPKQSLGQMVLGTARTIRGMSRAEILRYKAKHYNAENMVIACAGNVGHAELLRLVRKAFGAAPGGKVGYFEPARNGIGRASASVHDHDTEQVHLALGFRGVARNHPDRAVLKVLNVILGENMSSRLFQEIREKKGMAYDVSSSVNAFADTGTLVLYAGTESKKLANCLSLTAKVLRGLRQKNVPAEELRRAKEYAAGRWTLQLEKTMDCMLWLGEHWISLGEIPDAEEILCEIHQVRASDVTRVARDIFRPQGLCVQAIGKGLSANKMLAQLEL